MTIDTDYDAAPEDRQGPERGQSVDRDKLKELVEKVQLGDSDEGAEALEEVIEFTRRQDRGNVRRAENEAALARFAKKYPGLNDEILIDAAKRVLGAEIAADLRKAGLTDEQIAPVANNMEALVSAHGAARIRGLNVRNPDTLLDDVGGTLARKFNIKPASQSPTECARPSRAARI